MIDIIKQIPFTTDNSVNQNGIGYQVIDLLADGQNLGDTLSIQVLAKTKSVGGTGGTLTFNFAMLPGQFAISEILAALQSSLALALPGPSNSRVISGTAKLDITARYLHIWYNQASLPSGCLLDIIAYINGRKYGTTN